METVREYSAALPDVAVSRDYKYMCSEPGQDLIRADIRNCALDRIVVASCSPRMHEPTFKRACETGGLNPYLMEMANIREQCSWVTSEAAAATAKAKALVASAVRKARLLEPLEDKTVPVNPTTMVVGGGIAGLEAALKIADAGQKVYLVEKEPSIGGNMAKLDKTFPTLDCAACILTPKMVAVGQNPNITLLTCSEVEDVSGFVGNFKVRVRKRARYVDVSKCTGCGDCAKVCPVQTIDSFEEGMATRRAAYKFFAQAVPNVYQIDKRGWPACRAACPAGVNGGGYLALTAEGKYDEALALIRERMPFVGICSRICFHPCESDCRRQEVDQPVAINGVKRFLSDWEVKNNLTPAPPEGKKSGKSVAVVGSGPAGLSAAYYLLAMGHAVTVFEKDEKPGGLLRHAIPRYRLPEEVLDRELERLKTMGVKFRTGQELGRDFTLASLRKEGFNSVLLAIGAGSEVSLDVPGEDCPGVHTALSFLGAVSHGQAPPVGTGVIVIGGGNAAIDAARTAVRLGAKNVSVVYRRSRAEMPASIQEIEAAEREGVKFTFLASPVAVIGTGKVTGVKFVRNELSSDVDASGRRRPVPVPGSEYDVSADTVVVAIGQTVDLGSFDPKERQELAAGHRVKAGEWGETALKGVFAAGDFVTGPASFVEAVAGGRRAARAVDAFVRGQALPEPEFRMPAHEDPLDLSHYDASPRHQMPELDVAGRTRSFAEVEKGFGEAEARAEAARCLHCSICMECGECVRACEAVAVDHCQRDEVVELDVGAIVVATGYQQFDPTAGEQWGYGRYDDVLTGLQFERLSNASGPTQGRLLCKDGREPEAVAVLHCVGSRDKNYNEYCSRICCMTSVKFSHLVREKTRAKVYDLFMDMRTFGKQYEEFYNRVAAEENVYFIRGRGAEVLKDPKSGKLMVRVEDTLLGVLREIPVDMVILNPAMVPRADSQRVAQVFGIQKSADGFFLEYHIKLEPMKTATDGVFVAGTCQSPKDIPDTVAQGAGAAAEAMTLLLPGSVRISPMTGEVRESLCSGCHMCVLMCPYSAISMDEDKALAVVNEVLCRGCGTCSATCPSGAMRVRHFDNSQVLSQIEGVCAE
ncbi:MAG: FAD-dependent oxidoreductase [Bacillota bacterium]|nr:MAG: FAD-dependent oxidoreductase [Bacillota bacterium]